MTSQIDATKPVTGSPTTASVREQLAIARDEISALQSKSAGGLIIAHGFSERVWIRPSMITSTGGNAASYAANRLHLVPMVLPVAYTISEISYLISAGAAGNARVAIYDNPDDPGALPTRCIWRSQEHDTTSAGLRAFPVDLSFEAGAVIWPALINSAGISALAVPNWAGLPMLPATDSAFYAASVSVGLDMQYGSPPDTIALGAANLSNASALMFGLRV